MKPHAARARKLAERLDRIDSAVRKARRGRHQQCGVRRHRLRGRGDVGAVVGSDRHDHRFDVEVLRRLQERGVRRRGHDHLRPFDPACPRMVPVCLDREQDALGTPGGHRADDFFAAAEQRSQHRHDVALKAAETRKRRRRQSVLGGIRAEHLVEERGVRLAAIVDEAPDAPAAPVGIVRAGLDQRGAKRLLVACGGQKGAGVQGDCLVRMAAGRLRSSNRHSV